MYEDLKTIFPKTKYLIESVYLLFVEGYLGVLVKDKDLLCVLFRVIIPFLLGIMGDRSPKIVKGEETKIHV